MKFDSATALINALSHFRILRAIATSSTCVICARSHRLIESRAYIHLAVVNIWRSSSVARIHLCFHILFHFAITSSLLVYSRRPGDTNEFLTCFYYPGHYYPGYVCAGVAPKGWTNQAQRRSTLILCPIHHNKTHSNRNVILTHYVPDL